MSGTSWELDAVAYRKDNSSFLIVECRRYKEGSDHKQESLAAIAYRISDTGANGAFVVTPTNFQKGARLVAESAGIQRIRLDYDATIEDYVMEAISRVFLGKPEAMAFGDNVDLVLLRSCHRCGGSFPVRNDEHVCETCNEGT